jgi:glycosyltransferase involved in cell wall biosynthesis
MRILIDTTYALRAPHSGTAVYTDRIAEALAGLPDTEVVTAANARRRSPAGGGAASVANAIADLRFTELELPRRARVAAADVIHHALPAIAHGIRIAQVVTVHDLAFARIPEAYEVAYRRYARLAHAHAARRAQAVICVSHATAADVAELWGVEPERIIVAHHGPGQRLTPLPRLREPTHLLYVGDAEPRKDLPTLLEAHRRYVATASDPLPLIVAGSAHGHGHGPDVVIEHRPSAPRLAELLAGAAALVHPALHEGFGLTVLEAMRAGTPVIAASAVATREIGGDAPRYVPPGQPDVLATAIAEIAGDAGLRERLSVLGISRAASFSWNLAARAHRDAYAVALANEDRDSGHEGHTGLLQRIRDRG